MWGPKCELVKKRPNLTGSAFPGGPPAQCELVRNVPDIDQFDPKWEVKRPVRPQIDPESAHWAFGAPTAQRARFNYFLTLSGKIALSRKIYECNMYLTIF